MFSFTQVMIEAAISIDWNTAVAYYTYLNNADSARMIVNWIRHGRDKANNADKAGCVSDYLSILRGTQRRMDPPESLSTAEINPVRT